MTPAEIGCLNVLIDLALAEDLGDAGDVTSRAMIPEDLQEKAAFVARCRECSPASKPPERSASRRTPRGGFVM